MILGESLSEEPQDGIETLEEGKKTIEEVKTQRVLFILKFTADIGHEEAESVEIKKLKIRKKHH